MRLCARACVSEEERDGGKKGGCEGGGRRTDRRKSTARENVCAHVAGRCDALGMGRNVGVEVCVGGLGEESDMTVSRLDVRNISRNERMVFNG